MLNQMAIDAIKTASDILSWQVANKKYVGVAPARMILIKISQALDNSLFNNGRDFPLTDINCDPENQIISFWHRINDVVLVELEHHVLKGDSTKIDKMSINIDMLAGEDENIRTVTCDVKDVAINKLRDIFIALNIMVIPQCPENAKLAYVEGYLEEISHKYEIEIEILY